MFTYYVSRKLYNSYFAAAEMNFFDSLLELNRIDAKR